MAIWVKKTIRDWGEKKARLNYCETARFQQFERIIKKITINNLETSMLYKTIYEFCTI